MGWSSPSAQPSTVAAQALLQSLLLGSLLNFFRSSVLPCLFDHLGISLFASHALDPQNHCAIFPLQRMSYFPYSKKDQLFTVVKSYFPYSSDSCLEFTVHLSVRIPFQSFTERYKILRKSWGSSRKRVCDKSNSHSAEEKGKFLQVIPLPSGKIVTAPIWYHIDQIITVFTTILQILP